MTIEGDLNYLHYGEKYEGLDMRAEVGMLTRNIKVRFSNYGISKLTFTESILLRSTARWKQTATTLIWTTAWTIRLTALVDTRRLA